MKEVRDDHERAQEVAALAVSGDLTAAERRFLEAHLAACVPCARRAAGLEGALRALRSVSVPPAPALVGLTQERVRRLAARLQEAQAQRRGLLVSCVLASALTLITGLSVWRAVGALGWSADPWTWAPALLVVWFLPAVVTGAAAWAAEAQVERRES